MAKENYFVMADKLIINVQGDVYSANVQREVEDIFYSLKNTKVNRVIIYNEQGRSRSFLVSSK